MDKIKELMKAMNISEETSNEFVNIVEGHITGTIKTEKTRLQEDFDQKLNKIKKVCVEEVENEKTKLARGVQRFLTTQMESIKRASAKQLANEETENIGKLKTIKALVEGTNIDEAKANKDLLASNNEVKALKEQLSEAKTKSVTLESKVRKLAEISEKSILRQKSLETQLMEAKKAAPKPVVKEDVVAKTVTSMNEDRIKKATPVSNVTKQEEPKAKVEGDADIDQIAAAI